MSLRGLFARTIALVAAFPAMAAAETTERVGDSGGSALWIFANIAYAGMRAQNNPHTGWRIVAFLFGFPGTLLTYLVVPQGGERMYGIDVPRKSMPSVRT